jgi:uncharacterized protein (DUF433 family)
VEGRNFAHTTVPPRGMLCLRGLHIPVVTVIGMVVEGISEDEILNALPDLERQDIREALCYTAEAVREPGLPLVGGR